MEKLLLIHGRVCTPTGIVEDGCIVISNGRIECIDKSEKIERSHFKKIIDIKGQYVIPGFVDVHVHGGGGFDTMTGTTEAILGMSRFLARTGTTAFLPTTLTADQQSIEQSIKAVLAAITKGTDGAEVMGIHLEGPFVNESRSGAQNPAYIREPSIPELKRYVEMSNRYLRLITLAPEKEGAMEAIRYLVNEGITVSIGHSDASFEVIKKAVASGASHVTHLFNGMRPLHHREPGVAGSALMINELTTEIICDGYHVHPQLIELVFRIKSKDKLVLITDSVASTGLPDGDGYDLGGLPCYMKDGQVRLKSNDELAGSCLTMDQALRNMLQFTGVTLMEVLPAMTINPARQAKIDSRKGSIEIGKDADLVVLDETYQVVSTYVRGKLVYNYDG